MADQEPLFRLDRYSPSRVAVLLCLPRSNAQAFAVATAMGTWYDLAGTRKTPKSGKDVSGTLIIPKRRSHILAALGELDKKQWDKWVKDWCERQVAHRCPGGNVFLFGAAPFLNPCPACKQEIPVMTTPSATSKKRGPGFGAATQNPPQERRRIDGDPPTKLRNPRLQEGVISSTKTVPPSDGVTKGWVGVRDPEALEVRISPSADSSEAVSLGACGGCGHLHFGRAGRCRRPACECEEAW
jgi:hypothetical protein